MSMIEPSSYRKKKVSFRVDEVARNQVDDPYANTRVNQGMSSSLSPISDEALQYFNALKINNTPALQQVTPEMLKVLLDLELERLKNPHYKGGGFDPPYGPALRKTSKPVSRDAYAELLQSEWQRLIFGQLD